MSKTDYFYIPNFREQLDPDEAEAMGAFEETALTEKDAEESTLDLMEAIEND